MLIFDGEMEGKHEFRGEWLTKMCIATCVRYGIEIWPEKLFINRTLEDL